MDRRIREAKPYGCKKCPKKFYRPEHLQRHLLSHEDVRSFECQFCLTNFVRRDALLRHLRTCKDRINVCAEMPKLKKYKPGRKQIACERCSEMKRKCTRTVPCDNCQSMKEPCSLETSTTEVIDCNSSSIEDSTTTTSEAAESLIDLDLWKENDEFNDASSTGRHDTMFEQQQVDFDLSDDIIPEETHTEAPSAISTDSLNQLELIHNLFTIPAPISPNQSMAMPHKFFFLERITATKGMASCFDCGNVQERRQIMFSLSGVHSFDATYSNARLSMIRDARTNAAETDDANIIATATSSTPKQTINSTSPTLSQLSMDMGDAIAQHPLSLKSQEIVIGIRNAVQNNQWSSTQELRCQLFFSPSSLERHLVAFWSLWYPNWPVFHRPSFKEAQKPATLVAAMALIGAVLESDSVAYEEALCWMKIVETWVFEAPELSDDSILSNDESFTQFKTEERLDSIRAAYCMVLIMTWEGSKDTVRRARRIRYSKIVDAARSLLRVQPVHADLNDYIQAANIFKAWKLFIHKEELVRTLSYVFKLDCAYTIFNNCLPRMAIRELGFSLSCPEICFQVNTANEWLEHLKSWQRSNLGSILPQLSDVVEIILQEKPSSQHWQLLQEMTTLNFFAVISALHTLIFYLRQSPLGIVDTKPVLRGLSNWIHAWTHRESILGAYDKYHVSPRDSWKRVGFMRHVQEYWRLALVFCRQFESNEALLPAFNADHTATTMVETLDENDMGRVHDLIVRFQYVNLGEYDI